MNEEEEEVYEPDPSQGVAAPDYTLEQGILTKGKSLLGVGSSAIFRNIYTTISKVDGVQEMLTKAQEQLPSISQKGVSEFKTQAENRIQEFMRKLSESSFSVETLKRAIGKDQGGGIGGGASDDEENEEDPKDVPRNDPGTWMTAGQQSKPLSIKFFEDAGWRNGRLNLKSWREAPGDGKAIAELFLTAQGKGVVFGTERNKQNLFMSRVFGIEGAKQLLELPEDAKGIFQAHHNTATKAVLTGQEGLVYDSPYYHEIQKVWEDLELTLGNNPKNIIGTLGLVQRDLNSPHSLIHKFLDSKMGKDGTDFWTPEIMNQIVIYDDAGNAIGHKNFDLRVAKTKEQALIFKEAVDLLKLAHRQFYLAKGVKPGEYLTTEPILDEEVVDSFINKLPPKGGTGEYTTNIISKIAREVANEKNTTPTIKSGSLAQLIDEQVQQNVRDKLDKMYRFAVNQANGENMLIEVIFNNMKPKDAIKKYRGNDPAADALKKELEEAVRYNRRTLKQLYQTKFGDIPPAVTKFDQGADD